MADPILTIRPIEGHGLATIMARRGVEPVAIGKALGVAVPQGPRSLHANGRRLTGIGPGAWLLMEERAGPGWATEIAQGLAGLASVTDQSSGYALLEISGPCARAVLQKGLAIDLHPDAFPAGHAATSVIEHIGVILWCIETSLFHVATFRSYARDFRHWLDMTAQSIEGAQEKAA